jgi:hypothetical protein
MSKVNKRRMYEAVRNAKHTVDETDVTTLDTNEYRSVPRIDYVFALTFARDNDAMTRNNTPHPTDLPEGELVDYYLHADGLSGFGVEFANADAKYGQMVAPFAFGKDAGTNRAKLSWHASNVGAYWED